ncbi:hypothetical protein PLESTB_000080100 [Pleodorina starrii]|uniref:Isochorismatase-like domain-containing protein n=1 Tax=Pleodorina starrii TaxID=330485 RepID=A0A9W6BB33_9CHLO|nr:hypothetical protein PLESTM_000076600 [Pleodorina starrii]GLC48291.1 hypothetical protein PLESTB_000080100 [Pleodorina starrii]GLC66577.1 hypothetical protein PLESTF_000446000 [Pleodorina starrii]
MAYYAPQSHLRQEPIRNPHTACALFIDTQNYNCHRDGAIYKKLEGSSRAEDPGVSYFFSRLESVCKPAWVALQTLCRTSGVEVMYTVIQSLTKDGRDRSQDYVISGFHVPPGCWDAQVIDELGPGPDEMVLPKTSSSVFNSTNIDFILRSMGKRHLILAGCVTDQCVAHAVMDACDLGYCVTLLPDATATYSPQRQEAALAAIGGYCRMRTVEQLAEELNKQKTQLPPLTAAAEAAPQDED